MKAVDVCSIFANALDNAIEAGEDPELLREAAVKAGARSVILPDHMINKKDVSFLQDRYLTCWAPVSGRIRPGRPVPAPVSGQKGSF